MSKLEKYKLTKSDVKVFVCLSHLFNAAITNI